MLIIKNKLSASQFEIVFALGVLIFCVTRGVIPILFADPGLAKPTYIISFLFGITLSLYGLYFCLFASHRTNFQLPRKLMIINLALYLIWWIPIFFFKNDIDWLLAPVYSGLFLFSAFVFSRVPTKLVSQALGFLTIVIAGFLIVEYIEVNTFFFGNRLEAAFQRQKILRPEIFEAWSRTGDFIRPNGLFGFRPHDSANALAVLSVFWLSLSLTSKRVLPFVLGLVSFAALLMTTSASNILAALGGIIFVQVVICKKMMYERKLITLLIFFIIGSAVFISILYGTADQIPFLWAWTYRVSSETGAWSEMIELGSFSLGDGLSLFIGHGISFEISTLFNNSEIGLLKNIAELGIFHFALFLYVLLYPYFFYRKQLLFNQDALPYVAAVLVGVLSLWHYGSLLRVTNAFIFLALYAQSFVLGGARVTPNRLKSIYSHHLAPALILYHDPRS